MIEKRTKNVLLKFAVVEKNDRADRKWNYLVLTTSESRRKVKQNKTSEETRGQNPGRMSHSDVKRPMWHSHGY